MSKLVEAVEALKARTPNISYNDIWNEAIKQCLLVIRAHEAEDKRGNDNQDGILDMILKEPGEIFPKTLREHINKIPRTNVMVAARSVWRIIDALLPHLRTPTQPSREVVDIIMEALDAAPVYVTKDGTWLNLRPDAHRSKGGAMCKIEGLEAEAIQSFGKKVDRAKAAIAAMQEGK